MARPQHLGTRIFLADGSVREARDTVRQLGFLDGQICALTAAARKNPDAFAQLTGEHVPSTEELRSWYRKLATECAREVAGGAISIEVEAEEELTSEDIVAQGLALTRWIPNAFIRCPMTAEGLAAMEKLAMQGKRVHAAESFSVSQAAAVYAATRGAHRGTVLVSVPFSWVQAEGEAEAEYNGAETIAAVSRLFEQRGDGHVFVLASRIRTFDQFLYGLYCNFDAIAAPAPILRTWGEYNMPIPGYDVEKHVFEKHNPHASDHKRMLNQVEDVSLERDWREYAITHPLTDAARAREQKAHAALLSTHTT